MASDAVEKESRTREGRHRLDRLFEEWLSSFPFPRVVTGRDWPASAIRVDELRDNGDLVIRAELPGIDPDRDVTLTVHDGLLTIDAERREEKETEGKGYVRRESLFGSFRRALPLPTGVKESDVRAVYKDGILEIRVPHGEPAEAPKKVAITKG